MGGDNPAIQSRRLGCGCIVAIGFLLLALVLPMELRARREYEAIRRLSQEAKHLGGHAHIPVEAGSDSWHGKIPVILELGRVDIGDQEFSRLASMNAFTNLIALDLSNTRITDKSLKFLEKAPGLALLDVSRTQITDKGTESIARLPRLGTLRLAGTAATDHGIDILVRGQGSRSLGSVDLTDTKVTEDGVRKLSKAFRSIYIKHPGAVHPAANKQ